MDLPQRHEFAFKLSGMQYVFFFGRHRADPAPIRAGGPGFHISRLVRIVAGQLPRILWVLSLRLAVFILTLPP